MGNTSRKDPLVQPIIWSTFFAALTVGSALFYVMNTRAVQDYSNTHSKNYDPSGLGQSLSTFAGHVGQGAAILFGLITLICLITIARRVLYNRSLTRKYKKSKKATATPATVSSTDSETV